ncbi:hypothetical protein [Thalassotalea hakodatensis]|uniref:hypothetical protein n=1 Tax=Thalassotalea hakodatensis TaxID=3030492 RepID=UPI002572238C|nr:hypothetical protein [Thalassotalea hakodatensis]
MSKVILLIILLCIFAPASDAKNVLSNQPIQLDTRDKFNSTSIYAEVAGKEFVIFESISDFNFSSIALNIVEISHLADGSSTPPIVKELSVNNKYNSLAGVVTSNKDTWIYYVSANSYHDKANLMKGRLTKDGYLSDISKVNLDFNIKGGSGFRVQYFNNQFIAAYRQAKCCNLGFAKSINGDNFKQIDSVNFTGAMPQVEYFSNGNILYSYQRAFPTDELKQNGKPIYTIKSRYRISKDNGESWEDEHVASDSVFEIHDAFPYQRVDGGIDLYYSHGLNRNKNQLSLWRRCINENGKLGAEELVIGKKLGNIAKPNVYRGKNNALYVLFIEQGKNIKNGAIQYFASLENEARCI